jgi:hypothetical protein
MSRRWPAGLAALFAVLILASTGLCKPPDLPQYQNVTVLPNTPAESADPALLMAFGFLSNYPIQMLPAEDFIDPSSPCGEEICEESVPEPITVAPRQEPATSGRCTRAVKPVEPTKPAAPTRSVLENLELLEKASAAVQKAKEMAKEGEIGGAMECLQKAQDLVPGSPCSARINEMLEAMKAVKAQMEAKKKAISTESESPAKDARQPSQEASYHDGLMREITDAYKAACMGETAQAPKPSLAPGFPKIVIIVNGASCADRGGVCSSQGTCPPAVKTAVKVRVHVSVKPACDPPKAACDASTPTACGQAAVVAAPCPQKSCCPLAARIHQVPLVSALEQLRCATGCQVVIDFEGLQKAGVSPNKPVSLNVEGMPLYCALDLMLRPHQLQASVAGNVIRVTCSAECPRTGEKADPNACEEVCPRAAALHARAVKAALAREEAGKKVMVAGLMKACRLALADGRFEKAADLARQAHAVDPAAVEADPMVIKLDLLNQYRPVCAPKPHGPTAGGARPAGAAEEAEEAAEGQSKLVPHLPATFDVVAALEAIGRQAEAPPKK